MLEKERVNPRSPQEKGNLKERSRSYQETIAWTKQAALGFHSGTLGQGPTPAPRAWQLSPETRLQLVYVFGLPGAYTIQS